jgi:hypothetical protein
VPNIPFSYPEVLSMKEGQSRIRIRNMDNEIEIEGSREFVESTLPELMQVVFGMRPSDEEETTPPSSTPPLSKRTDKKLREFYLSKSPETHQDKVLVFVYWLQINEGKSDPTIKEIKGCYDRLSVVKPASVADVNKELRKKKKPLLLKSKTRGVCRLSIDGERYVKEQLPHTKT